MKTLLSALLFLGGMPLLHAQFTLTDSLAAWYKMDGNAADSSGNANHGTVFGAVLTTDRNGNPNSAYQFDGTNDYLSLANNQKFQPGFPITMAAWIYLNDLDNNNIFQNDQHPSNYYGFWLSIVLNGHVTLSYGDGGPIGPPFRRTKIGNSVLGIGTWYHVAGLARSANDMDVYINGKLDCGYYDGNGGPLVNNGNPGTAALSTGNAFFHGAIDDLRLYNRALSEEEIRTLADFTSQDTLICMGDSVQLDAGFGSLISWTPSDSLSCTNCSDPFAFPVQNTTYLALTANTPGCIDSVLIQVDVDNCGSVGPCDTVDLQADFQYSVNGNQLLLTDISMGNDLDLIQWNLGDGTLTNYGTPGGIFNYLYPTPGFYEVCVYALDFDGEVVNCIDTLCQWVQIKSDTCEAYQAAFSYSINGFAITVTDNSSPITQVSNWDFGDGNTASTSGSGSSTSHNYGNLDSIYTVCLEIIAHPDSQRTCRDTICQQITLLTGIEENLPGHGWKGFPNPSSGVIQIQIEQSRAEPAELILYDLSGRAVFRRGITQKKEQLVVLPELWPGVYLLQLQGKGIGNHSYQKLLLH